MATPNSQNESTILKTTRLLLRPLSSADADAVYALRSNPQVCYWKTPETREQSDNWFQAHLSSPLCVTYIVSLLATGNEEPTFIGMTGGHSLPEVGYLFLPEFWGKGYATEALEAWLKMYWDVYPNGSPAMKMEERGYLMARTGPGGDRSRRVLEKCGFRPFGVEEIGVEKGGLLEMEGDTTLLSVWRLEKR